MARVLYSVRLFSSGGLTSLAGTVGPVVPTGLVYVLRDVDAIDVSGTTGHQMELLNPSLTTLVFFDNTPGAGGPNFQWRGRQVFDEGEQLGFRAFSGTWSVMASGYQLTKP